MKTPQEQLLENLASGQGMSRSILTMPIASLAGLSIQDLLALSAEMGRLDTSMTRDLTTAQSIPVEVFGKGTKVMASDATDEDTEISVIFDKPNNPEHKLKGDQEITTPFERVFVKWSAQAGKSITLTRVLVSDLFQRGDRRKLTSIDEITTISNIDRVNELPSGATEVQARAFSAGAGSALTTLHTVTSGKKLYLAWAGCLQKNDSGGDYTVEIIVTNGVGTYQYTIIGVGGRTTNDHGEANLAFSPVITVPAGYIVKLRKRTADSDSTNGQAYGWIKGWEETA